MTAVEQTKAAAMAQQKPKTLEQVIQGSINQLKVALPQGMNAERMARIALTALRINPKLFEVAGRNPASFIAALFQASQLGLEVNTNNEAWLIPYGQEVKFQIGKGGWSKLFYNNEHALDIQAESVYKNDFFECNLGTKVVSHVKPKFGEDRGPVVGYYAQVRLSNGGNIIKTMSVAEAKDWAIRFSKCWSKKDNNFIPGTPWYSHFNSMAEGTVLKQALKDAPKSAEIVKRAFVMDESVKTQVLPDMATVPNEIDYSKQAESAEEVKAEPEPPVQEVPPPTEPISGEAPPATVDAEESKQRFADYRQKIEAAQSRAEVNTIYKSVEKDVEAKVVSEDHMRQLLDLMKKKTDDIKKVKK